MDIHLVSYIVDYHEQFMTETERLAFRYFRAQDEKTPQMRERSLKLIEPELSANPAAVELAALGRKVLAEKTAERILSEHAWEIVVNRCPRCGGVAAGPKARQCRFCYFDWHSPITTITYRIGKQDFLAAKRLYTANEKPWWTHISYQLQSLNALYIWLATRWYFYRAFETDKRFRQDFRADISPDGVHWVTSTSEDRIGWSGFVRYLECDRVCLLFITEFKFIIFPTRAFRPGQLKDFQDLARHIIRGADSVQVLSPSNQ
jgi:hypothetical protein